MSAYAVGLSAVMIGRDSAGTVRESLAALAPMVDEIVFVDTGSRDDTMAIAREFGCRVFEFAWCDDFSAARNFAIEQAKYRWIISIDTDEIVQGTNARALIDQAMSTDASAYLVYQDNLYDNGDRKPNPVARLFRNDARIRYRNPVHECVSESVVEHWPTHPWRALEVHLEHRGFLAGNVDGKYARNVAILQRWVAQQPEVPFANFKLGGTLWDLGRHAEALRVLDHAYALLEHPKSRARAPWLPTFAVIYHRALLAQRGSEAADAFEAIAEAWLAR